MPENDSFIGDMTAVTFLRQMAELSGLPPKAALETAHEVLFHVGLGEARYRELRTYSYGMKQMAKLARRSCTDRSWSCWTNRPTGSTRLPAGACSSSSPR